MCIWDFAARERLSSFKTVDVTSVQWLPDGEHLIFATTTPRLRVNNGFGIWHYSGKQLSYQPVERRVVPRPATLDLPAAVEHELYQVLVVYPVKLGPAPEPKKFESVTNSDTSSSVNKPTSVYVPPALRNRSAVAIQSMKATSMSDSAKISYQSTNNDNSKNKKNNANIKNTNKNCIPNQNVATKLSSNSQLLSVNTSAQSNSNEKANDQVTASDPKNQKQVNQLCKKLNQIEKLKLEQASGKTLAFNQLEKIAGEKQLRDELTRLCI
ncbi:unnamed protein product [Heterobilharzia americana]|nr:unnamed protein product [Heterobilharzia americana]